MTIKTLLHFPALVLASLAAALLLEGWFDLASTIYESFIVGHKLSFIAGSAVVFMPVIFLAWTRRK